MHWSLLKEMVHNELGDDPEDRFASFDKRAFAAASLGQVHRARLKTGEEVAVKIQYPGIARTIREDFRNLFFFLLPGRLSRDWENTKEQFDDLRIRLERETDYEQEAAMSERVRKLFREDDGIVVPRVYPEFSTARVLTMDYLEGKTIEQFMATNPSQEERNEFRPQDSAGLVSHALRRPAVLCRRPSGQFPAPGRRPTGPDRLRLHAGAGRRRCGSTFARSIGR